MARKGEFKSIRAQAIRGDGALDGLRVPVRASWYAAFQQELLSFPEGRHDDQVDALGLVGQLMDKYVPGHVPKKEPENEKWRGYAVYDQEKPLSILTQLIAETEK